MALTVPCPSYHANISLPLLEVPHLLLVPCFAQNRAVPGRYPQLLLRCFQREPIQSQQTFLSAPRQITLFFILQMLISFIFLQSFMGFQIFLYDNLIFQHVDKVPRFSGMVHFIRTPFFFLTSY